MEKREILSHQKICRQIKSLIQTVTVTTVTTVTKFLLKSVREIFPFFYYTALENISLNQLL